MAEFSLPKESLNPFGIGVVDSFFDNFTHSYIYPSEIVVDAGHTAEKIAQIFEDPAGKGVSMLRLRLPTAAADIWHAAGGNYGWRSERLRRYGECRHRFRRARDGNRHYQPGHQLHRSPDHPDHRRRRNLRGGKCQCVGVCHQHGRLLVKLGDGTFTLTGASTCTGNTVVDAGTLNVPLGINMPNATVYVATGGTLNTPSIVADNLTIGGAPRCIGRHRPRTRYLSPLGSGGHGMGGLDAA